METRRWAGKEKDLYACSVSLFIVSKNNHSYFSCSSSHQTIASIQNTGLELAGWNCHTFLVTIEIYFFQQVKCNYALLQNITFSLLQNKIFKENGLLFINFL